MWGKMILLEEGIKAVLRLALLFQNVFYCKFIANHFRAFDIIEAPLMRLRLPPHFLYCITVFPRWLGIKSITHPHTAQLDKWPPLCCQSAWPSVFTVELISFCLAVSGYKQKDAEGKDRTVFDIPIFTEEFLNHSKGKRAPSQPAVFLKMIICF